MFKHRKTTLILLSRENRVRTPIYEHEGKYYIKANKPNTSCYSPLFCKGTQYTEVKQIGEHWHTK